MKDVISASAQCSTEGLTALCDCGVTSCRVVVRAGAAVVSLEPCRAHEWCLPLVSLFLQEERELRFSSQMLLLNIALREWSTN